MSPRPMPSRHDASARVFLDAAASLIDAAMTDSDQVPARLRSIRYPAALEWMRVEDVLRVTDGVAGGSRKAFRQRWETREQFIRDAVVYTLQFADRPADEYDPLVSQLTRLDVDDLGASIESLAKDLLAYAESSPRSYLMLHIGGVLHRHPSLLDAFAETWSTYRAPFVAGYVAVLEHAGLTLRPDWTPTRFDRALQGLMDGFLLMGRVHPDARQSDNWSHADLFAETILAFTYGALDDGGGLSARQALSGLVRP